ncbi:nucleoredoxin [Thraustotheca clavata]|uniref:Nucleoredoxin n=1 Tax=Thraustotheca clavata TaxID=74557 RepID=A0A1V9ZHE7_9STRA|nr:nucleoredoxin [Thraustotheca clavata]
MASSTLVSLLGPEIQTKEGIVSTENALANKKVVGIYFSAHWCPPCRAFTPLLSTFYEDLVEDHDDVEIVFVSSDKEVSGFDEYWSEMTFKALPYVHRERKAALSEHFQVKFIPTLVFVNEQGEVITKDGVQLLNSARGRVDLFRKELFNKPSIDAQI